MSEFHGEQAMLEAGWALNGTDGTGHSIRLVFAESELARSYLGVSIGRHPQLAERIIEDPSVSRRHLRVGVVDNTLFVEDLNSLNGTIVDDHEIGCFQPTAVSPGQTVIIGAVRLTVARRPAGESA